MSQQAKNLPPVRGSPRAQRIGSAILGAFVATYLAIITYTFSGRLRSTNGVVELIFLWLIGLLALAMLSRAWRKLAQEAKSTPVR